MKKACPLCVALLVLAAPAIFARADGSNSSKPFNSKSTTSVSKTPPVVKPVPIASTASPEKPVSKEPKKKQVAKIDRSQATDSRDASSTPTLATAPVLHTDIRQFPESSNTTNAAAAAVIAPVLSPSATDIDTPGMLADNKSTMANADTPDLTLDLLPGESPEQAKIDQTNAAALTLRIPMSADQLHNPNTTAKSQSAANSVSKQANAATRKAPGQVTNPNVPKPVQMVPVLLPGPRPPPDPYDILNH